MPEFAVKPSTRVYHIRMHVYMYFQRLKFVFLVQEWHFSCAFPVLGSHCFCDVHQDFIKVTSAGLLIRNMVDMFYTSQSQQVSFDGHIG